MFTARSSWCKSAMFPGQVLSRALLPHHNGGAGSESGLGCGGQNQPGRLGLNRRLDNDLGVLAAGLDIPLNVEELQGKGLKFRRVAHCGQPLLQMLGGLEFLRGPGLPVPQFFHQFSDEVVNLFRRCLVFLGNVLRERRRRRFSGGRDSRFG